MAAPKEIRVEGNVATLTLYRPERGNSITPVMAEEILAALDRLEADPSVRVIVLTGAGKYFCTGMDLGADNQGEMEKTLQDGRVGRSILVFERLRTCPKPIVARINGPAMGGGWGLIFTSDIRIATDKSFFWFAEVKRGIVPAIISAYIVPQTGPFIANQWMLTGRKMPAAHALQLGLLSQVCKEEELDAATKDYCNELLTSAPGAMAHVKRTVAYVASHKHEENLAKVKDVFAKTVHSEEALYGMGCFLQKQTPDWSTVQRAKL